MNKVKFFYYILYIGILCRTVHIYSNTHNFYYIPVVFISSPLSPFNGLRAFPNSEVIGQWLRAVTKGQKMAQIPDYLVFIAATAWLVPLLLHTFNRPNNSDKEKK